MENKTSAHYQRMHRQRLREQGLVKKEIWILPEYGAELQRIEKRMRLPRGQADVPAINTQEGTMETATHTYWTVHRLAEALRLLPLVQDGRLRALAVSTQEPSPLAPGLPPIALTLPGFDDASFNYLVAAARTPPEAIAAINAAIGRVLAEPTLRARLEALGAEPLGGTPEQLAAMVQSEIARWRGVITAQGITLE